MSDTTPSVVFLGTPEFAVPALNKLVEAESCSVIGVITQPDRPAGRGLKLTPPPIKVTANSHNIPVFQPASIKKIQVDISGAKKTVSNCKDRELLEFLNSHDSIDFFAVAAYGKIIPSSLLNYPNHPMLNIHPSLLPRWRGAAPIQRAIFEGDAETGVTIMQVDEGLDSGPIFCQAESPISADDDLESLHDRLSAIGADLLLKCIEDLHLGRITPAAQNESGATYAEKWDKTDSEINWTDPADLTLRRIRACSPFPGARTHLDGRIFKIYRAHEVPNLNYEESVPGSIVECNKAELVVRAGNNTFISVNEVQLEGKKRMKISELMRGYQFESGSLLS
jgi:methionyl-tRNA formyltransferase